MPSKWSKRETEILRRLYPYVDNDTLAWLLDKSRASVENKASRMGLKKVVRRNKNGQVDGFVNRFELISREEAEKLDQIDLLRVVWSLAEMYQRELNNENLTKEERHKLMNAFSSHLATLNNVMRGREKTSEASKDLRRLMEEYVREMEEEEELEEGEREETRRRVRPRRVFIPLRDVVLVT